MYVSTAGGLGQQRALDPTVKGREAALIQLKIKEGERDPNRLANEAFWDRHREDQWGKCKAKLPDVPELRRLHREWIELRNLASTLVTIASLRL
jgi:hypothetical protein